MMRWALYKSAAINARVRRTAGAGRHAAQSQHLPEMSAFTRRGPLGARAVDTGTRAGLHGQTLLSTGIADLDTLLGGGLPLGALLLVLEDPRSQQHLTIVKHFLAEGLACGHTACWLAPSPQPGGPGAFVPAVAAPRADADASPAPQV
jgi:hypothetical protein